MTEALLAIRCLNMHVLVTTIACVISLCPGQKALIVADGLDVCMQVASLLPGGQPNSLLDYQMLHMLSSPGRSYFTSHQDFLSYLEFA